MIKLKEILLEGKPSTIFIPRRIEDRFERRISLYIRNGSKGDLDLSDLNLTKLPEILKDITVGGNFYCSHNKLTSLINAPKIVTGNFTCYNNFLTSLEGAPKVVDGSFDCGYNKLTSLENSPKSVSGDFYCINNKLTSLVGAPKIVGGDFWCSYNLLTTLEGAPKVVGKDFFCNGNPGNFTSEQVRAICDVKGRIIV